MGKNPGIAMTTLTRYITFIIFLSLISLMISFGQLQNDNSIGGLAGTSMSLGFGARGIAMGNALTAVINGDVQAYYNPASIPFISAPTITAAYSLLSLDRKLNYLSYTNSIKPNAGISLAIINAGVGNIDGRDYDGNHTQTYSTSENSFILSFGIKPGQRFSFGVSVKVLYFSLFEGIKSTTAAIDVGAIFLLSQQLTFGLVIQDIGSKYKWNTSELYGLSGNSITDRFPLRKRFGLSWVPVDFPLIISSEFESISSSTYLRLGSEFEIYEGVHIRGGFDQIALNTDEPAKPALGISLQKKFTGWATSFQYGYVFEPYSPNGIHILSLAVRLK
jgi:hypothetical protein